MNCVIDHTNLKPNATKREIEGLCEEARNYEFASVCVNGCWVKHCASLLRDCKVSICCVVGFPLGAMSTKAKVWETTCAIEDGADEIDVVMNIAYMKDGEYELLVEELKQVVQAAQGRCVKVILETCLLSKEEIQKACECCVRAQVDYVKTSTGFSTGGARVEDVKWMKECVQNHCKVKASGGIRDLKTAQEMIQAGADRLGVSAGVQIMEQFLKK